MNVIQDQISLSLSAEKIVINETVKLVAYITAQVSDSEPPETLPVRVREMMDKVVDTSKYEKVKWNFSNMQRTKDTTGFERVTLMATARVPETENYNLDARADAASKPGLMINNITADTSIPAYMIENAISELRKSLAAMAKKEAETLSDVLERSFRVSDLQFSSPHMGGPKTMLSNSNSPFDIARTYSGNTGSSGDEGVLGNAQKVVLNATISLASIVDMPDSYRS